MIISRPPNVGNIARQWQVRRSGTPHGARLGAAKRRGRQLPVRRGTRRDGPAAAPILLHAPCNHHGSSVGIHRWSSRATNGLPIAACGAPIWDSRCAIQLLPVLT